MAESSFKKADEAFARKSRWLIALMGLGIVAAVTGFIGGSDKDGDVATNFGILAGVGIALVLGGAVMLWIHIAARAIGDDPGGSIKRERLQTQRSRQLWVFPVLAFFFLIQAIPAAGNIIRRTGDTGDYLHMVLPVLYAWMATAIVMGWDGQTRKERKFLEDELTRVLRARAMSWAFIALMAGVTASLGLGLWRQDLGIASLPLVLSAAGATAAIRFVWLDREAGQNDG
ncbi:hypothetical protein HZ989_14265 [Brevundimonas sp. AJA228-03]|uniref:hypothetical protein n=1 Tax=Brevundimonas sp. AJA228-03 TaxID=2752515 RepID=UPI001ADFF01A|nr:hypothetical protein [Brevundimonas sp. AJA228-03]QTN19362.1 hypothetical protein HZ989_14265 [Brevundimonas sp. AJA228-03]